MLFIASDHAAFLAKNHIFNYLQSMGLTVTDLGPESETRSNYPEYAVKLAREVINTPKSRGILLCGSGQGVAMAANKFKGIRAARCLSVEDAELSVQHNESNVLCLGARVNSNEELENIVKAWLEAKPEGGRHSERVAMFSDFGSEV